MDIVNLSLGAADDSPSLKKAVDKAYSSGVLVVASAGNEGNAAGTGDTVAYPAHYDSVIAVAATDAFNLRGWFSSTGPAVEVAAPGIEIASTYLNNYYAMMDGTSMAAPYVSGTLALLKQANPTLTNVQLRAKLQATSLDLGVKGRDSLYSFGLIQAPIQKEEPVEQQVIPTTTQPKPAVTVKPAAKPVAKPAPKPAPKPVAKKKSVTSITTSKTSYYRGNTVWITTRVVDSATKKPVAGATVRLTITPPKGKSTVITAKTNSKGYAYFKKATNRATVKGSYKLATTVSINNYYNSSATRWIKVR